MKNIILIVIDDLRFDAISCNQYRVYLDQYGLGNIPCTPNIDFFADNGIRFTQAISVGSYTPSTHASLFTGLNPTEHGVRAFAKDELKIEETLTCLLCDAGYTTIVSADFMDMFKLLGIVNKDFEFQFKSNDKQLFNCLDENKNEKLFLFAHFNDVHPPYSISNCPPVSSYNANGYSELVALGKRLNIKYDYDKIEFKNLPELNPWLIELSNKVRLYCEDVGIASEVQFPRYLWGVNKFDSGRFRYFMDGLKRLGLLNDCLLVITSDHGQAPLIDKFGRKKFDHGETVQEELIRIPLVLYSPKLFKPRVIDNQCSQVDIMPTIMEYAGIDFDENEIDGCSLSCFIEEKGCEGYDTYSEVWWHDRQELSRYLKDCLVAKELLGGYETSLYRWAVRTPDFKYVGDENTDFLYDLENDPFERTNIASRKPATVKRLKGMMP